MKDLPKDKAEWNKELTVPCQDVVVKGVDKSNFIKIKAKSGDKDVEIPATFLTEMTDNGEGIKGRYLAFNMDPSSKVEFDISLSSEYADSITVVPAVLSKDKDNKDVITNLSSLPVKWAVKDVAVTDVTKNQEDVVIDFPRDGEDDASVTELSSALDSQTTTVFDEKTGVDKVLEGAANASDDVNGDVLTIDDKQGKVGKDKALKVSMYNSDVVDKQLRVYLVDGKLKSDFSADTTKMKPAQEAYFGDKEKDTFKGTIILSDGTKKDTTFTVYKAVETGNDYARTATGNRLLALYAETTVPAGAVVESDITISTEKEGSISLLPVMVPNDGSEPIYGDVVSTDFENTLVKNVATMFKAKSAEEIEKEKSDLTKVQGELPDYNNISQEDLEVYRVRFYNNTMGGYIEYYNGQDDMLGEPLSRLYYPRKDGLASSSEGVVGANNKYVITPYDGFSVNSFVVKDSKDNIIFEAKPEDIEEGKPYVYEAKMPKEDILIESTFRQIKDELSESVLHEIELDKTDFYSEPYGVILDDTYSEKFGEYESYEDRKNKEIEMYGYSTLQDMGNLVTRDYVPTVKESLFLPSNNNTGVVPASDEISECSSCATSPSVDSTENNINTSAMSIATAYAEGDSKPSFRVADPDNLDPSKVKGISLKCGPWLYEHSEGQYRTYPCRRVMTKKGNNYRYPNGGAWSTYEYNITIKYTDGRPNVSAIGPAICAEPSKHAPKNEDNARYCHANRGNPSVIALAMATAKYYRENFTDWKELDEFIWGKHKYNDNDKWCYVHMLVGKLAYNDMKGVKGKNKSIVEAAFKKAHAAVSKPQFDTIELTLYRRIYFGRYDGNVQDLYFIEGTRLCLKAPPEPDKPPTPEVGGGLSIQKVSTNGSITDGNDEYSLEGAIYGVYTRPQCDDASKVMQIKTNKDGYAATGDKDLKPGMYYVKEIQPSPGFNLDPQVYTFEVMKNQIASQNKQTSREKPNVGEGRCEKVSDNPSITDDNNCYSLAGAVYGIYKGGSLIATMVTDERGHASSPGLPLGAYDIKEITPSEGFKLDTTVHSIYIPYDGAVAEFYSEEPCKFDPGSIEIEKLWSGKTTTTIPSLEGTEFTINYYDGYYTKGNLPAQYKRHWVFMIKKITEFEGDGSQHRYRLRFTDEFLIADKSDPLYKHEGQVVLPLGTYTIQETKPAPGYTLGGWLEDEKGNKISIDSDIYVTQVNDNGSTIELRGGHYYFGRNDPKEGSITIKKFGPDGTSLLKGAVFECRNALDEVIATSTTDANGTIHFKHLYPDVYTITEVESPDGYTHLKDPIVIEVPTRVTKEDIDKHHIDESKVIYDKFVDIYYIFDLTYEITNTPNFVVPMTGGVVTPMTFVPLAGGVTLFGVLTGVLLKNKKKK